MNESRLDRKKPKKATVQDCVNQLSAECKSILKDNEIWLKSKQSKPVTFCGLCNLRIGSVSEAVKHVSTSMHSTAKEVKYICNLMEYPPPITEAHRTALNASLRDVTLDFIDKSEAERRLNFAQSICLALESRLTMRVVGSILTGFSLKQSDVNLDAYSEPTETVRKNSQSGEIETFSFVDPYDRGFSSALPEIFDVLCTTDSERRHSNGTNFGCPDFPVLPEFFAFRKTSVSEGFSIIIEDSESTCYCITVGNPHGQDFAALIRTYLSIDDRAKRLMTLLLKFAQLAYIESLPKPALYALVVFFLQHTSPPVLPNLHELSRHHRDNLPFDSIETAYSPFKVRTEEGDSSYLKDLSVLPQFFSSSQNTMTVADIWLKFLRFYAFEFQSQSCVVSISHSEPVPRSSRRGNLSGLWVERKQFSSKIYLLCYCPNHELIGDLFSDPFSPSTPLTRNLSRPVEKFIRDQFVAAYSYFGIPRLAKTGRPAFTNVLVNPIQPSKGQATSTKSPKLIPLNFMSSTDLDHNLNKVNTKSYQKLLTIVDFLHHRCSYWHLTSSINLEVASSASTKAKINDKLVALGDILLETLRLAYSEICPADFVAGIQRSCYKKADRYLRGSTSGIRLNSPQATEFFRAYCRNLWHGVQGKYQNCPNHATEGQLGRIGERILSMTLRGMSHVLQKNSPSFVAAAPKIPTDNEESMESIIPQSSAKLSPMMTKKEPSWSGDAEESMSGSFQEEDGGQRDKSVCLSDDLELSSRNIEPFGNDPDDFCNPGEIGVKAEKMNSHLDCIENDGSNAAAGDPWSKYIKINVEIAVIQNSNKPDYYSSAKVNFLKPEDLSFPFIVRPSYDLDSYSPILGSDVSGQPSSMIAHLCRPPPVCTLCGVSGHCSSSCVAEPQVSVSISSWKALESKVPQMSNKTHLEELSDCLIQLSQFHSCQEIRSFRQVVVTDLNKLFRAGYPDVSLKLFGSCANGFETSTSDMDICIVFPPNSPQASSLLDNTERLTLLKTFRRLLGKGSRNFGISNIRPVYFAKVPIIKFTVADRFEVDLSFSNFLAINNTEMLNFYNQIDSRLRVLNIALKIVLKACKVPKSDAGGISSYAFAIMLIHYLQQRNFLPLYEGTEKPVINVGKWNVWYQNDMNMVRKLWKPPEEDVTVADLWFGFLRYYLFEFDREHYIVTIKQKSRLDRFGKLWESLLAVEDPFNLRHNLTNSVGRKGYLMVLILIVLQILALNHVLHSLHSTLLHHTTFIRDQLTPNQWKFYLFSEEKLNPYKQARITKKNERKDRPSNGVPSPQVNLTPFFHPNDVNGISTPSSVVSNLRPRGGFPVNGAGVNRAAARLNRARTSNHHHQQQQEQYRRSQHVASAPSRGGSVGHRGAGASAGVPFARGAENRGGANRSRGRGQRRNP
ncbi:Terminal uridylyltransferase 7 [Taenia solium]